MCSSDLGGQYCICYDGWAGTDCSEENTWPVGVIPEPPAGFVAGAGLVEDLTRQLEHSVEHALQQTQYETFCTAQDASTLNSVNRLVDATTVDTAASIGLITTLDQSPPTFTVLGAKGINENTIQVTFRCNEACRAYCRVTRSDSGESSLSINRILKADYKADQAGGSMDQTIQLSRLEDDSSLDLLERGAKRVVEHVRRRVVLRDRRAAAVVDAELHRVAGLELAREGEARLEQ